MGLEASRAYDAKVPEVIAKQREELETKTASELKEILMTKGLKLGVAKSDRIETLLEDFKTNGDVDKMLVSMTRAERREELWRMDKLDLKRLCESTGADPLVKEIMV